MRFLAVRVGRSCDSRIRVDRSGTLPGEAGVGFGASGRAIGLPSSPVVSPVGRERSVTAAAGRFVTKTGYVGGLGCRKEWWLLCNAPGRLPPPDASGRFRRAQGQEVGAWARQRYPHGLLVPAADPERSDRASREMLSRRLPLFEAGFLHPDGTCYARADILVPVGREEWDLVEVKSRTGPEEEDVHDVAFQRYCFVAAGVRLRQCRLLHLDGGYVRSGEIDPDRLFAEADITA